MLANLKITSICLGLFLLLSCKNDSPKNSVVETSTKNEEKISVSQSFEDTVVMKKIQAGEYRPLYGKIADDLVQIDSFEMDEIAVTNQQFLSFVKAHPEWRKSQVKRIFADENYLDDWDSDTSFGDLDPLSPVHQISWFAAKAYAKSLDKDLPTVDQWEYVAMADAVTRDARKNKAFNQYIISNYETPKTYLKKVKSTYANIWGVWDLHGVVWEWTDDFSAVLITGESRKDVDDNTNFCGSGALSANDLMNYAAFMRYAFRGSLKASYCVKNLGFRCVKNYKK